MPQITLEHTNNINISKSQGLKILKKIHSSLNAIGEVKIENCKSRLVSRETYLIGKGSQENGFIHIEIAFLEGRSEVTKKKLGEDILSYVVDYLKNNITISRPQVTIQFMDIPKSSYFKYQSGTL